MLGAVAELTVIDGKQAEFEVVAKELEAAVAADEPDVLYYKLFKVAETPQPTSSWSNTAIRPLSTPIAALSTSSAWARRWARFSPRRRRSRAWRRVG